ncbi:hypothetical protein [Paenibacillus thalictri]|uniref:Uncharacterized protein n=1 Tax=Paenibacillus thalictri TaxID=2527873 RepID=A0A4Q9DTR2_9BACL|nr:hypothetical protein [Paenibacillus thalictri]TBL77878.1 hypothetical protein EYB31_17240 [Paenibacillus thalictri]
MSVYVYSSGPVSHNVETNFRVSVNIENRTTTNQTYRVIVWNTSAALAVKQSMFDTGVVTITGNKTDELSELFTAIAFPNVTSFEVEIRLSSMHMAPWLMIHYYAPYYEGMNVTDLYAGEMFRDFTNAENP